MTVLLQKYRFDILFILTLIVFVLFKWSHLAIPYIFDEANFYGPAVIKMYENGPSLSPEAIPVFYSRGHPLFFHFLGSSWMSAFGSSLLSSHLFALTISILLLISVYYFCSNAFSKEVGLTSALILLFQPIFLAQSNLVLPEILLALLMITALLAYLGKFHFIYWISAALSMMTKESALVLFCAIPLYKIIEFLFEEKKSYIILLRELLFIISPISIWILFLIWQKLTLGWFLFPEHQGLIDLTPLIAWEKFTRIFMIVFIWSSRNTITISILLLSFLAVKNKTGTFAKIKPYLLLALLFYILFAAFSAINFFTNRYIISLVVLLAIMCGIVIHTYSPKKILSWLIVTIILIGGAYSTSTLRYDCDHNLGYVDAFYTTKK